APQGLRRRAHDDAVDDGRQGHEGHEGAHETPDEIAHRSEAEKREEGTNDMSTRIRLRRMGSKGRPFYRVVVADQRSPRDGRFIEIIGRYHPLNDPSVIEIDADRALHWLMVGAQPSNQVRNLMTKVGIWERFVAERPSAAASTASKRNRPVRTKLSKK